MIGQKLKPSRSEMPAHPVPERRSRPQPNHMQKCPRCESLDTKFCYYNNYSLSQPRYFCKNCKRYWTEGGSLRNVPVGGGLRKNKRSKQKGGGLADTASKDNDHQAVASIPGKLSSSQDAPKTFDHSNFRASNSVADEKYSFDSVRWAQRLYDSGEEASLGSHFNYMEAPPRNHALHLFPDYSYNLAAEGYDAGSYSNNLLQDATAAASSEQGQSNNSGEMSEVLGATPPEDQTAAGMQASCSDPATSGQPTGLCSSQQQDLQAQKQIHRMEDEDEDEDEHEDRSGAAMASKNKLLQSSKPTNGATMHDTRSEEICGNIVNPYDWQLISEGLFSTSGDFFYFPGASWPDVSHFESGPG